jgi:hypothetical protein
MVARHRPSVGTMSVLLFSSWIEKKKDPKYPTLKLSTPQRRKVGTGSKSLDAFMPTWP